LGQAGLRDSLRVTFRHRNFRLYALSQLISLAGTFMQAVAEAWLVLKLGGSGTVLGLVVALEFLPILLFAGYGGVLADRFDRRRLYLSTQSVGAALALLLGILTVTHVVQIWMVAVIALGIGCNAAVDQPCRQGLIYDTVGPDDIGRAAGISLTLLNVSAAAGNALAAAAIRFVGVGGCFFINAASFAFVIVALLLMRKSELYRSEPVPKARGRFRSALAHVRAHRELLAPLILLLVFAIVWQEEILLPLLARITFHGSASLFAFMAASLAAGAVAGGIYVAAAGAPADRRIALSGLLFSVTALAVAVSPALLTICLLFLLGAFAIVLVVQLNSTLQVEVASEFRGRVMALYVVCMYGTRPLGAPIIGLLSARSTPRLGFVAVAAAMLVVGMPAWNYLRANRNK
jgi:MFS family permease